MEKILVTPRSITKLGHPALKKLEKAGYEILFSTPGEQPKEEELKQLLPQCVGYLAGVEKVTASVLESAGKLRVISRNGVGIDNIDLKAAEKLNIKISKTDGANSRGVAELALSLMFSLVRNIPYSNINLINEKWERRIGIEILGKTLGIIGCGRIGKELANLALSLNMKVIAYDPFPIAFFTSDLNFSTGSLEDVWRSSDIISLHCPPPQDGSAMVNEATIDKMKKGVYIINTARAALIDESAMIKALDKGSVSGFATDVFDKEPPGNTPIIKHSKVIATPHIGGFTNESVDRAVEGAVDNLIYLLKKS